MSGALASNFHTVKLEAPPWSLGDQVKYFGNYELLGEVAKGGMGVVWRARQQALNRTVAVKMIRSGLFADKDEVQRFHAEAQAVAQLRHPNIVNVHEIGEHEGQHYYSMDFIEGSTLAERCHGKAMNVREAAELLRTVCEAVHFAHQRGFLHRDLKPHNIMVDSEGRPHVLDFGLAKRIDEDQSLTLTGAVLGSPSYMAPEQAEGRNDRVGPHTDVYALGAILYQMLTGRPPFLGRTAAETMMQVVQREPAAPSRSNPDLPRDLETICLKCLEKEPAQRYATARELGEELGRFLKGDPVLARPANFARKSTSWLRHHPAWLAGAAALLVFGLLCTIFWLYQENAFMRAQHLNPALKQEPGPLSLALLNWFGMGSLIVMTVGLWVNVWFMSHARRSTLRAMSDQARFAPGSAVPNHVRVIEVLAGLGCILYGLLTITKVIEAYAWEGFGPLPNLPRGISSGYLPVAFFIVWLGFWMIATAWLNRERGLHGAPVRRVDEAMQAEIREAVAAGDASAAIQVYHRAVPEAGLLEAREYVNLCIHDLRVNDAAKFQELYQNPCRALTVRPRALIAVLVVGAVFWIVLKTSAPLQTLWYVAGGVIYFVVALMAAQMKGFLLRFLSFIGCAMIVFTGGSWLFEKPLPGHIWLLMGGLAAAMLVFRPGLKRGAR